MSLKNIILGTLTWVIIILLLTLPLTFLVIWKLCVILVAKCIRRDLRLLTASDIMNAPGSGDSTSTISFGLVLQIQGHIGVTEFRKLFAKKFLDGGENPVHERFLCSLITFGGFPFFKLLKRDEIDITETIFVRDLKPGESLEDLISDWILTKYRKNGLCWEIVIVPLKAKNQTALAFKIHHAFADGYSALYILDQLSQNSSPYLVKDFDDGCGKIISQMLQTPTQLHRLKGDVLTNPLACVPAPPPQWSISFTELDLDVLKKIRRTHNVHFGSIILSLLGGALGRYLLDTGKKTASQLPPHLGMGMTLPWPRHPSKNPQTPVNSRICNHWVTGIVKVPIGQESLTQRLLQVEKDLLEYESQGMPRLMKYFMIPLMWFFPAAVLKSMFSGDVGFAAGYSATIGGDGYKLLGQDVVHIHPILATVLDSSSQPFIPISTASFTHSNKYELTFAANPQHFPDRTSIERMSKEYLPQELARLMEETEEANF